MNHFISCDWGTTSFRIRLVQLPEMQIVSSLHQNDIGFGQITLKRDEKISLLQQKIDALLARRAPGEAIPCILSGMASSSIGISELPYGKLPISLKAFALPYEKLDKNIFLVSGLADEEDVMRGEEVQIAGAVNKASGSEKNTLVILPGTHSKHALIQGKELVSFQTFLSGELFSILLKHSILKHSFPDEEKEQVDITAFQRGIAASSGYLLHELFAIRARQVLGNEPQLAKQDFLSGLLIGAELRGLPQEKFTEALVVADGKLSQLYQAAIRALYPKLTIRLFSTEQATILGHYQLIENLKV